MSSMAHRGFSSWTVATEPGAGRHPSLLSISNSTAMLAQQGYILISGPNNFQSFWYFCFSPVCVHYININTARKQLLYFLFGSFLLLLQVLWLKIVCNSVFYLVWVKILIRLFSGSHPMVRFLQQSLLILLHPERSFLSQ